MALNKTPDREPVRALRSRHQDIMSSVIRRKILTITSGIHVELIDAIQEEGKNRTNAAAMAAYISDTYEKELSERRRRLSDGTLSVRDFGTWLEEKQNELSDRFGTDAEPILRIIQDYRLEVDNAVRVLNNFASAEDMAKIWKQNATVKQIFRLMQAYAEASAQICAPVQPAQPVWTPPRQSLPSAPKPKPAVPVVAPATAAPAPAKQAVKSAVKPQEGNLKREFLASKGKGLTGEVILYLINHLDTIVSYEELAREIPGESVKRLKKAFDNGKYQYSKLMKKHGVCPVVYRNGVELKTTNTAPAITASAPKDKAQRAQKAQKVQENTRIGAPQDIALFLTEQPDTHAPPGTVRDMLRKKGYKESNIHMAFTKARRGMKLGKHGTPWANRRGTARIETREDGDVYLIIEEDEQGAQTGAIDKMPHPPTAKAAISEGMHGGVSRDMVLFLIDQPNMRASESIVRNKLLKTSYTEDNIRMSLIRLKRGLAIERYGMVRIEIIEGNIQLIIMKGETTTKRTGPAAKTHTRHAKPDTKTPVKPADADDDPDSGDNDDGDSGDDAPPPDENEDGNGDGDGDGDDEPLELSPENEKVMEVIDSIVTSERLSDVLKTAVDGMGTWIQATAIETATDIPVRNIGAMITIQMCETSALTSGLQEYGITLRTKTRNNMAIMVKIQNRELFDRQYGELKKRKNNTESPEEPLSGGYPVGDVPGKEEISWPAPRMRKSGVQVERRPEEYIRNEIDKMGGAPRKIAQHIADQPKMQMDKDAFMAWMGRNNPLLVPDGKDAATIVGNIFKSTSSFRVTVENGMVRITPKGSSALK